MILSVDSVVLSFRPVLFLTTPSFTDYLSESYTSNEGPMLLQL